jgi:hypothetical protein
VSGEDSSGDLEGSEASPSCYLLEEGSMVIRRGFEVLRECIVWGSWNVVVLEYD